MSIRRAASRASCACLVFGSLTAANRSGALPLSSVAATPREVEEGKVWLLVSSALVADRPWLASLLGFGIVASAALAVLTVRTVVSVAVLGHVLSALVVYLWIGVVRVVDPGAFASVLNLADFGLSAMIAAWIGALARFYWRCRPTRRGRLLVALGCLVSAGIGLACSPHLTFLDSEHLVAFGIGLGICDLQFRPFFTVWSRRFSPAWTPTFIHR